MKHDITLPDFAEAHVTRWLKRHEDGGRAMSEREDVAHVRDWLMSLSAENPKMVSKLHKLHWDTAMKAQPLWHEAMARRAEKTKEFGGAPDDIEHVHDLGHVFAGLALSIHSDPGLMLGAWTSASALHP